jgi:probable addiction module antidote protein
MKKAKMKSKLRTLPWDPARYLKTEKDCREYLDVALEDGDPALIAAVLGDIAKAKGMAGVARKAGLGRESLYKALSQHGDPKFDTIMKVMNAVGIKLKSAA